MILKGLTAAFTIECLPILEYFEILYAKAAKFNCRLLE